MSTDPVQRASDPATPLEELQYLAQNHPSLRPLIAENPSTYPELLEWLGEFSDPEIAAALQRRQNRLDRAARAQTRSPIPAASPAPQEIPVVEPRSASPLTPTNAPAAINTVRDETPQDFPTASLETAEDNTVAQPAKTTTAKPANEPETAVTAETEVAEKTKADKLKLADEEDLEDFSPVEEKTASRKSKIFVIVIAILIGLVLSIGGNLTDRLTGGDGSKSWYGKDGVIARIFGDSDLNRDHNNNGIPDDQENGANGTGSKNAGGQDTKQKNSNAGAQLDVKTEGRQIAPAPTNQIGQAKGLPNGAYQVAEFSLPDAPIKCTIGNEVVCNVFSFTGNIGQNPGATVKFTLGADGAKPPEDLGVKDNEVSQTVLASGAAAASGAYACESSGSGVDCWNLQTGFGLKLTVNSAEAYQPKVKAPGN